MSRRSWKALALVGLFAATSLAATPAWAVDDEEVDDKDELAEETVSGQRPPALKLDGVPASLAPDLPAADMSGSLYSERVRRGARQLNTSEEFVAGCIEGVEHIYRRNYKAARDTFQRVDKAYPGAATEEVGQVLIWQALMLENFDFRFIAQYEDAYRRARMELEEALYQPGNEAWEHFILGGILGIDAIHTMRTGEYLKAFNRGLEAMKSVNRAKELAPEFKDSYLGDGLFNYWRTVIAMSSKALPDLGDQRAKGIAQMQAVESEGIFLGPAATLALVFTWMEEGDMNRALESTLKNQRVYPENVVNNLVLGRVYMYMKRHDDSEQTFLAVLQTEPDNQRVHYYLTRLYLRTRDIEAAEKHIDKYLAFDLDDESRGYALYQKGLIDYRRKNWSQAESSFKEAWKLAKLDRAKRRLDQVKEKQKAGG